MSDQSRKNRWIVPAVCIAALVIIFSINLMLGARAGKEFEGTDAAATKVMEDAGRQPWFQPLFEPKSSEIESGLFAMQAALGAGILGFALGRMSAKRPAPSQPVAEPKESATQPCN